MTDVGVTSQRDSPLPGRSGPAGSTAVRVAGAVSGLLAAALALGVAQLVAGITGPAAAPVVAVGRAAIDVTPRPVTDFAIRVFGPNDKTVLLTGIVVVIAVFAAAFGVLAVRRLAFGYAGLVVVAGIGLLAVTTRPDFSPVDVIPTIAGAAAGMAALGWLAPAARSAGPIPPVREEGPKREGDREGDTPTYTAVPNLGRRRFLTGSVVAAGGAAAGGLIGNALAGRTAVTGSRATLRIPAPAKPAPPLPPGTDLHIPGLSPFLTPNGSFYRVDTAIVLPQVSPQSWRLRVHGMVDREITLSLDDLLRRPLTEAYVSLTCVSNPVGGPYAGNARWLGVPLASVLREAGIKAGADQLLCTSVDGFTCGSPVATAMDGRDALLAVAMNGVPLPVAHGFPVRMVVPGLYGYVSATKWVTDINVTTFGAESAYWVQQGWAAQGPIRTSSRIDIPNGNTKVQAGRVPVAGVAWAQRRGVAAVQVRVDGGAWQEARLAAVPGIDTWRQWLWEWDATGGTHTLQVRATDETGFTQPQQELSPFPSGAQGWHTVSVNVT
jgi:DMSO/TMAO reductase YedYZ molybdopterin-dependent catalytic subunit